MLGPDPTIEAAPAVAATHAPLTRSPPEPRVVENTARSELPRHETPTMFAEPPSSIEQLVSSARQFADILDTTRNVQVAAWISGFRVGVLDLYA